MGLWLVQNTQKSTNSLILRGNMHTQKEQYRYKKDIQTFFPHSSKATHHFQIKAPLYFHTNTLHQ
jgi:hypothetical protein